MEDSIEFGATGGSSVPGFLCYFDINFIIMLVLEVRRWLGTVFRWS